MWGSRDFRACVCVCVCFGSPIPLNLLGSYSLVGIGKFNLLFLWLIGGVRCVGGSRAGFGC